MSFFDQLAHAWNAFTDASANGTTQQQNYGMGASYSINPSQTRMVSSNDRSIIASLYMRIGIDTAAIDMQHVRLDANDRFVEKIKSGLNERLNLRANLDQGASAFKQDMVMTLFDKGAIAVVPVDTNLNPNGAGGIDILSLRVGYIVNWYPRHVRVSIYNDVKGRREEITVAKSVAAIIENPLYAVMNEPNSTLQRLIRKLNLLDSIDEAAGSGKLDMIIQLPYVIKSEARKEQAQKRAQDIELQLKGSKYGIAYTDGTEKITQLNRPVENNMLAQIEYLTNLLYSQLGLTPEVFNGSASEEAMINYYNRTVEPVLRAIAEGFSWSFLTKTARTQGQSITYFRDPFRLVPVKDLAEIADKFTRNEIVTSNEFRGIIGFKPSTDPKADQLVNSNMPQPAIAAPVDDTTAVDPAPDDGTDIPEEDDSDLTEGAFDDIDKSLDEAFSGLGVDLG